MGRHARPKENRLSARILAIIGVVLIMAITAGVTAYFVWPSPQSRRVKAPEITKVTREELLGDYRKGEFKALVPKLDAYLVDHKDDFEVRSWLASSLVLTGKADRAVKEYKTLIDAKPDNSDILYQAGVAMGQLGRVKDAIDYLGKATKVSPGVALYHSELARLLVGDKQYDIALTEWQQALSLTAQNDRYRATIFAEMASIYVAKGQVGAAKEIVDNGLKIDPQNDYLKSLSAQIAASQPAQPATETNRTTRRR